MAWHSSDAEDASRERSVVRSTFVREDMSNSYVSMTAFNLSVVPFYPEEIVNWGSTWHRREKRRSAIGGQNGWLTSQKGQRWKLV